MTSKSSPNTLEEASAGCILWVRSDTDARAPRSLGGQSAEDQKRIVGERIHEDGLAVDRTIYAVSPISGTSDQRLRAMLTMLERAPIRHLYIAGSVYDGDSESERMMHHLAFLQQGVHLTICEDD